MNKFKGFSYEDGRIVPVAYLDGYIVGDRMLQDVAFKCEINPSGEMSVCFADPMESHGLDKGLWERRALEAAKKYDVFSENVDLTGEDLVLEEDEKTS
jgi:hypothetical protein